MASLEALLEGEGDKLVSAWPGNLIALVQQHGQLMEGYVLYAARQKIGKSSIVNVLDTIRNRVLEFCLRLAKEGPELMTDDGESPTPAASTAAGQVFTQVIIGSQIGNVANASPAAEQSAQIDVETGDLAGLVKALSAAGVPSDEVDTLRVAIEGRSGETARQECDGWLNRGKQAVASGAWSLAQGVTIATIREAVTAYLRSG